ncbi:sensor domain-containing diguanylate cyclase/phosphohydrolase [Syntrophomonas erecta]
MEGEANVTPPDGNHSFDVNLFNSNPKELLAALFSSSPIGIYIVQDGKFVLVNTQFQRLTGYTQEELLDTPSFQLILPKDRPLVRNCAVKMLKGKSSTPYEYRILDKHGDSKWIMETVTSVKYAGKPATLGNFMDISIRKTIETALRESQDLYRDLFENANDIIFILDLEGNFVSVNKSAEKTLGYSLADLANINVRQLLAPYYKEFVEKILNLKSSPDLTRNLELEIITKEGYRVPIELRARLLTKNGVAFAVQGIARDITERKTMENQLRLTNQRLMDIIDFLPDATFVIDDQGKVIAWNRAITEITGVPSENIIGTGDFCYSIPFYRKPRPMLVDFFDMDPEELQREYDYVKKEGNNFYSEVFVPNLNNGKGAYIWAKATPLFDSEGNRVGAIESIRDISDRKKFEEQLKYLGLHDTLTGLYNRNYFEEEMHRLESGRFCSVGLIICDMDGLKLVNDTLGHDTGDNLLITAAALIKNCFRANDVVARIGGDEFAVLVPDGTDEIMKKACCRIRSAIAEYNIDQPDIPLSLSVGYAVRNTPAQTMQEIFDMADNNMYREKLQCGQNARSTIVQTLLKTLQARDHFSESHGERISQLVTSMAKYIGLPGHRVADMRLFAEFHDIGKVGIPESILGKPAPLSTDERKIVQRHCEIGHRIALSAPELVPIADWILKHHEWWNGKGYPLGLKGEQIPLECRILALADSYDAMTSDRPYRKSLTQDEALEEIKRCAGTQFDPRLSSVFIYLIKSHPSKH